MHKTGALTAATVLQKRLSVAATYVAGLLKQALVVIGPPQTFNGKVVGEVPVNCLLHSCLWPLGQTYLPREQAC